VTVEIELMFTLALNEVVKELVPRFEAKTGSKIVSQRVPTARVVQRLNAGETTDVVMLSAGALEALIAARLIVPESRVDLATCGVAVAVRAGARRPDMSSAESLKRAVLDAKSIVYSTGPSGVYLQALFRRMGIEDAIAAKVKQVQGEPAGALVARGEAEIGFQQMCELLPIAGIEIAGPLPPGIQEITRFAGGVHVAANAADAAKALLDFFSDRDAASVMRRKGLDPV